MQVFSFSNKETNEDVTLIKNLQTKSHRTRTYYVHSKENTGISV